MSRFVILTLSLVAVGGFASAAEFETPLVLTGGTVVTEPGTVVEGATVVIEDGRIVGVGESVETPPHARTIDVEGLWLYPGFIDAATHVGVSKEEPGDDELSRISDEEKDMRQGPRTHMQHANRKGGVWPHISLQDVYETNASKLAAYRKAGFTTALVAPHPAILSGSGAVLQLSGAPLRRAMVRPDVAQVAGFGRPFTNYQDYYRRGYPISRMGVFALMRQTFLDAEWYQTRRALAEAHPLELPRVFHDPVLESLLPLLDREQPLLFAADTVNEIHHALNLCKELDQRAIILGGREAWRVAERLAKEEAPVIATLDWDKKPRLAPKQDGHAADTESRATRSTRSWTPEWEEDFFEPIALRKAMVQRWEDYANNVKSLLDAGVDVALTGRDTKNPNEMWTRMREMLELELTAEELLACLTTNPAQILGVEDQLGSIAPGKVANLVVMTKPFDEKKTKTRYIIIDGAVFEFDVKAEAEKEEKESEEEEEAAAEDDGEEEDESEEEEEKEDAKEPEVPHKWTIETDTDREPRFRTGGDVLLRNAHIATVTNGDLYFADILVEDGKIAELGRGLEAPAGVTTIDLSGHWVMPGIIDPHSHLAIRGVNESSQSITAEVQMADVVDPDDLGIHRALAGGVTTIHSMHGSANAIGGQNVVFKMKYRHAPSDMILTSGPRLVKFALGENVTRANVRERGRRFPNSRMGVESVLRQAFKDALEYKEMWEAYEAGQRAGEIVGIPRRDLRMEALNDILAGDVWIHCHSYRADEIARLLAVTSEYGVRVACMQHVLEGYRVMPEMHQVGAGGSTFSDNWAYKMEAYNAIPYNAAMMLKYGIVSSLNSDSGEVIRHMNLEAAKSMRFGGLTADEALSLITINPAIQLGLEDRIGSIEEGKDADLAVFTKHPLDSFARCVLTLIDGEVFFQGHDFEVGDERPKHPSDPSIPAPPREPMPLPKHAAGHFAIIRGTVHPVSGPAIHQGMVVLRDGKIEYVGEHKEIPNGASVVDASGLHVYPGLINAATQLGLTEIGSISGTRDTSDIATFQPEIRSLSAVNPFSAHVNIARAEGVTTAMPMPSGGYVSGRAGLIQLEGWSMPEMLRAWETGLVVNLPSLPNDMDEEDKKERIESHQERIEEIEAFFEEAQHYAAVKRFEEGRDGAINEDVRLDAMVPYVTGQKPVFFNANSYKEILEALEFAEVFELSPVIVGGRDAWKLADRLVEENVPVIVTTVFSVPRDRYDLYYANYANPARLHEAGVTFCIAETSAANAKLLPINAGQAVAYGLDPDAAVRSITLSAAEILGVSHRIGSLEEGKTADVIVTTGHPCQANSRTVLSFINGNPVELTSLHEENREKFANRPDPNLKPKNDLAGPPPLRLETFEMVGGK